MKEPQTRQPVLVIILLTIILLSLKANMFFTHISIGVMAFFVIIPIILLATLYDNKGSTQKNNIEEEFANNLEKAKSVSKAIKKAKNNLKAIDKSIKEIKTTERTRTQNSIQSQMKEYISKTNDNTEQKVAIASLQIEETVKKEAKKAKEANLHILPPAPSEESIELQPNNTTQESSNEAHELQEVDTILETPDLSSKQENITETTQHKVENSRYAYQPLIGNISISSTVNTSNSAPNFSTPTLSSNTESDSLSNISVDSTSDQLSDSDSSINSPSVPKFVEVPKLFGQE